MTRAYAGIGSRETPTVVLKQMSRIAARLWRRGYTLRSGGAAGADQAFERGASKEEKQSGVSTPGFEIYLPWVGFNGRLLDSHYHLLDFPKAAMIARRFHPAWYRLSVATQKLHARNAHQILGADLESPVAFVVCWTADGAETARETSRETGGTGTAIRLASKRDIPVFNLQRPDALERLRVFLTTDS